MWCTGSKESQFPHVPLYQQLRFKLYNNPRYEKVFLQLSKHVCIQLKVRCTPENSENIDLFHTFFLGSNWVSLFRSTNWSAYQLFGNRFIILGKVKGRQFLERL